MVYARHFRLLLLLNIFTNASYAQTVQLSMLNIGDAAPPLQVREWIKGEPVQEFEKGRVYVVEFWATWCAPCKAAMPHLSTLASKYKDSITVLGIDIMELKTTSFKRVKAVVDSLGDRMNYRVAAEDSNFMETGWLEASGERNKGIPSSFVVNAEGRLAWIGHPKDLDIVLPKIVNNTWDIKEALAKRNSDKHLAALDDSVNYELMNYAGNAYKHDFIGKPDSALLAIDEIIRIEPTLKYAPFVAFNTFSALLKTNPHKACEYGKVVMVTATYEAPACNAIIDAIEWNDGKLNLDPEIYQLGAQAYQIQINQIAYPEIVNMHKLYHKMAAWYWLAADKPRAIEAEQKAIESLNGKKDFSKIDMAAYQSQLERYKK